MNSELNVLNDEEFRRRIPVILYLSLLILIGLPGNVCLFVIYYRYYSRTTHRIFILTLALINIAISLISLPFEIVEMRYQYTFMAEGACKAFRFFGTCIGLTSPLVLVTLAINRFRLICQPFKPQMSSRVAFIGCVISIAASPFLSWPSLLVVGIRHVDLGHNVTGFDCSTDDHYKNSAFPVVFYAFVILLTIFGIVTLAILYGMIAKKLYLKAKLKRNPSQLEGNSNPVILDLQNKTNYSNPQNENIEQRKTTNLRSKNCDNVAELKLATRVTKIGFLISITFAVCYMPFLILSIITAAKGDFVAEPGPVTSAVLPILSRSPFLSTVLNPAIHCFYDARLRKIIRSICCHANKGDHD